MHYKYVWRGLEEMFEFAHLHYLKGNSRKGWQPFLLRQFRAPKFNSHSSEWLCCYRAVIQYWTLSPVDFCSPTVILMLSNCIIYIFKNGFWFFVPFFGGTSATFLDFVKSSDSLITAKGDFGLELEWICVELSGVSFLLYGLSIIFAYQFWYFITWKYLTSR